MNDVDRKVVIVRGAATSDVDKSLVYTHKRSINVQRYYLRRLGASGSTIY